MSAHAAISHFLIIALVLFFASVDNSDKVSVRASGVLAASPESISEMLTSGGRITRSLVITNTGATPMAALLYEASAQPSLAMAHAWGPASVPLPQQEQSLDPRLALQLDEPSERGAFIVYLHNQADLSAAYGITDWGERGRFVYRTLVEHAERTQRALRAELLARGLAYRPFWIVNAVYVEGTLTDVQALERRADVALVRADARVAVAPQVSAPASLDEQCSSDGNPVCWNIRAIGADRVWNEFGITGQGVTVASIDTGVLGIHPALRDRYRGALGSGIYDHNYNWYDPQGVFPMPVDQNGHGTHTTGTIVGSRPGGERFGVAPGARWILRRGVMGYSVAKAICSLPRSGSWRRPISTTAIHDQTFAR